MNKVFKVVASISLSLLILSSIFFHFIDFEPFYIYEIEKNNIEKAVDIPKEELLPLYKVLTDYMQGKIPSIQKMATVGGEKMPMYNQREIDHMVDVKLLVDKLKGIMLVLVMVFLVSVFALVKRSEKWIQLLIGQFISTVIIFMGFVLMALTDFTHYFMQFHKLLFTNDLWLLDPMTDRMIMLLPEVFFRDMVLLMITGYGFVSLLLAIIGVFMIKRRKHKGVV